jgi:hypothetical protein
MTDILASPEFEAFHPEVIGNPKGEALAIRYDVSRLLETKIGVDWQREMGDFIAAGKSTKRTGAHWTVREPVGAFVLDLTQGEALEQAFPAVWELYEGVFKQMTQAALPAGVEPMKLREHPNQALEPFSQRPADKESGELRRMEAHVDQCYTSVLAIEVPENGETQGGRLVIANNAEASSVKEITDDAVYITHKPGTLLCFSRGRVYPHFTEEVTDPTAKRIMLSMNYPVESETPEEARELTGHAYNEF